MDILKFGSLVLVKALITAFVGFAYYCALGFLLWDMLSLVDSGSSLALGVLIVTVVLLSVVIVVCKLLSLHKLLEYVFAGLRWALGVAVVGVVVFWYKEMLGDTSSFAIILIFLGTVIGLYLAYLLTAWIVNFFGAQFEVLGNALPRGRGVLFAETLASGYNKPQNKVFISELSQIDGGTGYVFTTFILYGIPLLTLIAVLTDIL